MRTYILQNVHLKKVCLLLRKLGTTEHTKFINYILLQKVSKLAFTKAGELYSWNSPVQRHLFHKRWRCLNLTRKEEEDYSTFASEVNNHCDDFRIVELSADNFKYLIFILGLVSTKDAEIRQRILNKLENELNITLQQIAEDCQKVHKHKAGF